MCRCSVVRESDMVMKRRQGPLHDLMPVKNFRKIKVTRLDFVSHKYLLLRGRPERAPFRGNKAQVFLGGQAWIVLATYRNLPRRPLSALPAGVRRVHQRPEGVSAVSASVRDRVFAIIPFPP